MSSRHRRLLMKVKVFTVRWKDVLFVGEEVLEAGRFVAGRFVAGHFVEGCFVGVPKL